MAGIYWVTNRIALSGLQPKSAVYDLQRQGITAVLNLTVRPDPQWPFRFLNDGAPDDGTDKSPAWFGKGIAFALRTIHDGGKILVHCNAGIHRAPSMVYAILRAMGRSPEEATQLVLRARPIAVLRYAPDAENALRELGLVNHDAVIHEEASND